MNRLLIFGLAFLVAGVGSVTARAASENPFGFETEKHPLKYDYCKQNRDPTVWVFRSHGYRCSSAPRDHPDFHEYWVSFVEEVGVCGIIARTYQLPRKNDRGQEPSEFQTIREQISQKYGPATSKSGSELEPVYEWSPEEGFPGVGEVQSIRLSVEIAGSTRFTSALFILRAPQCKTVLDKKASRAF